MCPYSRINRSISNTYKLSQDFRVWSVSKGNPWLFPVRKQNQVWFQVHRARMAHAFALIENKGRQETYLVPPQIYQELIGEVYSKVSFQHARTRQGVSFLWPIQDADQTDDWTNEQSALQIVTEYAGRWVRVGLKYGVGSLWSLHCRGRISSSGLAPRGFQSRLQKAFRGKIIDSIDHPIVRKLRGKFDGFLDRFSEIWFIDFEFRAADGGLPEPVCVGGQRGKNWPYDYFLEDQLIEMNMAPFATGNESLPCLLLFKCRDWMLFVSGLGYAMNVLDLLPSFETRQTD